MSEWLIGLSEYIGDMSDELDSVKAENAKLQNTIDELRMQELGIEVDA